MPAFILCLFRFLRLVFSGHQALAVENLALRRQLAAYKRICKRPRLNELDRLFWIGLSRVWTGWRGALVFVQPDTVVRWQRDRFRRFWARLSRVNGHRGGRPALAPEVRRLILRIARANLLWRAPRIHGELKMLGIHLIRDRDGVYGLEVQQRLQSLGVSEVLTAPQSPWQNGYAERLIGSIRRECLNHFVILSPRHLKRTLTAYLSYYHRTRTHLGLGKQCPVERQVMDCGAIVAKPELGGLHHRYERLVA